MTALEIVSEASIRRWSSRTGGTASIAEVVLTDIGTERLAEVLAGSVDTVKGCSMLIVALASMDRPMFLSAWATAQDSRFPVRICFAVDRKTLARLGTSLPTSDRIGILLDGVDDETPLADVARDAVEAVRFESGFVARASEHLRSECVLDALLALARSLGVATLGARARDGQGFCLAPQEDFDFVPDCSCGH